MKLHPNQYICSIPILQPPAPENQTANELARAQEARELSRATENGWGLLADLQDSCIYFMSGWWSYSFCNNREIVQFHALPSVPNGQPPKRDPHTAEFILGRTPAIPASSSSQAKQKGEQMPLPAELQVKGDQRYLVQRLEGGDICDLTGRDRTIEVQYHCVPGLKADRIGWIKEVTICAYLMVINTPRLCDDVAFLPPQETRANLIKCQLVVDEDSSTPLLDQTAPLDKADALEKAEKIQKDGSVTDDVPPEKEVNVGGVVVGARNVLSGADEAGKPPIKLAPPRSYFANTDTDAERFIEVVASGNPKEDGGAIKSLSTQELEQLGLSPKVVRDMEDEMKRLAKDQGWKLELVELPGGDKELRGYIDVEEDGEGASKLKEEAKKIQKEKGWAQRPEGDKGETKEKVGDKGETKGQAGEKGHIKEQVGEQGQAQDQVDEKKQEKTEGSEEEFYKKDEL